MKINNFNIRVYGLLIQDGRILVTDEHRNGFEMTKFPGGGLEFGEGIKDCLKREFEEELEISIQVNGLFYTNDFLQISHFNPSDQLISLYYFVEAKADINYIKEEEAQKIANNSQHFRWVNLINLNPENFTFPIDKIVASLLREFKV